VVALHRDAPLADAAQHAQAPDNILARLVFLRLGRQQTELEAVRGPGPGRPRHPRGGGRAARAWLQAHDVPADGLVLENGSGSRAANASRRPRWRPCWPPPTDRPTPRAAQRPAAGRVDGMRRRFQNQAAQGRPGSSPARSTTVAVAGYVRDRRERDWVVVAIVNQPEASRHGAQVVDRLVNWVAEQR
jgi:D-alanyl-D-alanine carboxypeptidase